MLFLDNTCHKSGWSVPYDFSSSSALTRCFISPCNLISISQHLLNIYRRTSIRQFQYEALRSFAGTEHISSYRKKLLTLTLQIPLAIKFSAASYTAIPCSHLSLPPETHCVHHEESISGASLNVYGHAIDISCAAQQVSSHQKQQKLGTAQPKSPL